MKEMNKEMRWAQSIFIRVIKKAFLKKENVGSSEGANFHRVGRNVFRVKIPLMQNHEVGKSLACFRN